MTHASKMPILFRDGVDTVKGTILGHFIEFGQTQDIRSSTRYTLHPCHACGGPPVTSGESMVGTGGLPGTGGK